MSKFNHFLILSISIVLLTNCKKDTFPSLEEAPLKTIHIGDYSMLVPQPFEIINEQGIDSYVGKIIGFGIEISFDFGAYNVPFENLSEEYYVESNDQVGIASRQLVIGNVPQKYSTALFIRDEANMSPLGNYISLKMEANHLTEKEQELVIAILKSVELTE